MKKETFDAAMNYLDNDLLDEHLTEKNTHRLRAANRRRQWTAAGAACVAVAVVGIGVATMWDLVNPFSDKPPHELEDVAIAEDFVTLHYVAEDGSIVEKRQYMTCDALSIFSAWRTQNGLGEEVRLTDVHTAGGGTEWSWEYEGEGVLSHQPEDTYTLTITVEGLAPHLDGERGDALLESLRRTLGGYTGIVYASIEVILR